LFILPWYFFSREGCGLGSLFDVLVTFFSPFHVSEFEISSLRVRVGGFFNSHPPPSRPVHQFLPCLFFSLSLSFFFLSLMAPWGHRTKSRLFGRCQFPDLWDIGLPPRCTLTLPSPFPGTQGSLTVFPPPASRTGFLRLFG